jgi:hypothetical protein
MLLFEGEVESAENILKELAASWYASRLFP